MTTELILTTLVGMFAFLALSATLRLREVQKKLLKRSNELYDAEKDAKYWEASWESLWRSYRQLTTIDDGPDTGSIIDPIIYGDSGLETWKVEGADSTPPDSWTILTP